MLIIPYITFSHLLSMTELFKLFVLGSARLPAVWNASQASERAVGLIHTKTRESSIILTLDIFLGEILTGPKATAVHVMVIFCLVFRHSYSSNRSYPQTLPVALLLSS